MQVIDVREDFEWADGHIANAVHIPLRQLPDRLDHLERNQPLLLVCQVGLRSGVATTFLKERGYDAHNLQGGMEMWMAQGLPLAGNARDMEAE